MSLREGDLQHLVYDIFEIDSYQSKMGDDKNIITLSFSLYEKAPADDLMNFIEKGYPFVLDADVTAGEQSDGMYRVFVEMERDNQAPNNILELLDGVKKLAGLENLKFRYYKNFRSIDANEQNLEEMIPIDPDHYGIKVNESNLENYKNFFSKSYVDSIDMLDETLIIKKPYADSLKFKFIDIGESNNIKDNINGTLDIMESYPEVLFLTKYLGDYNINKYGENLVLENQNTALVLKRT